MQASKSISCLQSILCKQCFIAVVPQIVSAYVRTCTWCFQVVYSKSSWVEILHCLATTYLLWKAAIMRCCSNMATPKPRLFTSSWTYIGAMCFDSLWALKQFDWRRWWGVGSSNHVICDEWRPPTFREYTCCPWPCCQRFDSIRLWFKIRRFASIRL